MNVERWVQEHTIHRVWAGSRLYGTERPDSDWDERGVCLMPPQALLGLVGFEQYNIYTKEQDTVIYGLTKFFKLALGCNPNILEVLFAPPEKWLVDSSQWCQIYRWRHRFLSQRVRYTFSGYALSQLKRLQRHYAWLTNPPTHKPTLEEFDGCLERGEKGAQRKAFPNQQKESDYTKAAKHWEQYQTWLKERNPARAKLEAEYGYDTKHACNLVRMMLQGQALLETGDFCPVLSEPERGYVLDVLNGTWDYAALVEWAMTRDKLLHSMDTPLPQKPDVSAIEQLLMQLNRASL